MCHVGQLTSTSHSTFTGAEKLCDAPPEEISASEMLSLNRENQPLRLSSNALNLTAVNSVA